MTIDILKTLAPDWTDEEIKALLTKYNDDYEKAANAIFDPNVKETLIPIQTVTTTQHEVIDLTGDDTDEMAQALRMSLQDNNVQVAPNDGPTFGPSNRTPDANWQLTVASGSSIQPQRTYDGGEQDLQEAIQRSMETIPAEEDTKDIQDADVPFRDLSTGQPLSIHAPTSSLQYAGNLIHALIQVPQVQASLRLVANSFDQIKNSPTMEALIGHAAHQDHANIAFLVGEGLFGYNTCTPTNDFRRIGENSEKLYEEIITDIETHTHDLLPDEEPSLGSMKLCTMTFGHEGLPSTRPSEPKPHLVPITYGESDVRDDLVTLISNILFKTLHDGTLDHTVLMTPLPDVVVFSMRNEGKCADAPYYPPTLFMDRFLYDKVAVVQDKLQEVREMERRMLALLERRRTLTGFKGNDTLKDLKTTQHFYEKVANGRDQPDRRPYYDGMVEKFKKIIKTLEQKVADVDVEHATLMVESQRVFECPEMQEFPYDLRAVLISGGPPGRKNLYSYVQDVKQRWWKTVDTVVTEVPPEEVLSDSNGVLLGAGPYMLIYSRRVSQEAIDALAPWPNSYTENIISNNKLYLEARSQEIGGSGITRDVSMVDLSGV